MAALEQGFTRIVPLGRIIEAEDIAKAVLYLASDDSTNVTGAEIIVDGGLSTAPQGSAASVVGWANL